MAGLAPKQCYSEYQNHFPRTIVQMRKIVDHPDLRELMVSQHVFFTEIPIPVETVLVSKMFHAVVLNLIFICSESVLDSLKLSKLFKMNDPYLLQSR